MVPAKVGAPKLDFNPLPVDGMVIDGIPELIKLLAVERYVDIDKGKKIIRFYIKLTDEVNEFIIEIPYFIYLATGNSKYVICKRYRIKDFNRIVSCIEIHNLDKPVLYFKEKVEKPLAGDNLNIQEMYTRVHKMDYSLTRVLNEETKGVVTAGVTTSQLEDGVYLKHMVHIEDLMSGAPMRTSYRELELMGDIYKVDLMGVCI